MDPNNPMFLLLGKLRSFRGQGSPTSQRLGEAFALIDNVNITPTIVVGEKVLLGQRISFTSGCDFIDCTGNIRGYSEEKKTFELVLGKL
jgi:hypothetical protein